VIFWINGIGDRCESFSELLELVADMLASDLAERHVSLPATA
jgi:hypothetical protein